ncbi:MAG: hypothetical protein QOG35_136 [Solirubrobacteraceae bacterium]|jgi:hypothetical protein|nr:hypothetical protein [Solirubrobacteraceae bacterium]
MWRRLRRRTFAPTRPVLFPEQWGLALVTALALMAGIAVAAWLLTR